MIKVKKRRPVPNEKRDTGRFVTGILLSTIFLAVLFYWFLGFATHDIRSIKGPDYDLFLEEKIGKELKDKQESLGAEISRLNSEIRALKEEQALKSSGSKNMEATLEQLNKQIASTKDDAELERLNRRLDDFLKIQQE
jgi:peptidoglycan hydrolase CwlO-like protein